MESLVANESFKATDLLLASYIEGLDPTLRPFNRPETALHSSRAHVERLATVLQNSDTDAVFSANSSRQEREQRAGNHNLAEQNRDRRDRLIGGPDDDYLYGGDGSDRITGGAGRDHLVGGSGSDRLTGGHDDDHLFGQSGRDRLHGNHGRDVLDGGTGRDRLWGGRGDDVLIDRDGGDKLSGGQGADTFQVGDGRLGATRIRDFQPGTDQLTFLDLNVNAENLALQAYGNGTRMVYQGKVLAVLPGIRPDILSLTDLEFGDASIIADMQAALDYVSQFNPGATLAVTTPDGFMWTGAGGLSDVENQTPMQASDRLEIGSITKSMTAVAILQLIQEGKLTLETPLSQLLPMIARRLENGSSITLRQLLQHTSGMPDLYTDEYGEAVLSDPMRQWEPRDFLQFVYNQSAAFQPGDRHQYSNTNYLLLGMVIEAVTDDSLASQFRTRIFEPLGMEDSFYPFQETIPGGFLAGYINLDNDDVPDHADFIHPTARGFGEGGVVSTAADLARFAQALTQGELLAPSTFEQMIQDNVINPDSPSDRYGLGIDVLDAGNDVIAWGHSGGTIGSVTTMYHFPNQGFTVTTMTNFEDVIFENPATDQVEQNFFKKAIAPVLNFARNAAVFSDGE